MLKSKPRSASSALCVQMRHKRAASALKNRLSEHPVPGFRRLSRVPQHFPQSIDWRLVFIINQYSVINLAMQLQAKYFKFLIRKTVVEAF